MNCRRYLFVLFLSLSLSVVFAQSDTIKIKNGSFEGEVLIRGDSISANQRLNLAQWFDCGAVNFIGTTPPDIHPNGRWGVAQLPVDGETYLGMVTRRDETWESVSQRLDKPMEFGQCYEFTISLCQSEKYVSATKDSKQKESFTAMTAFRMWAGSGYCNEKQLLVVQDIDHTEWKEYSFRFKAKDRHRYFLIEAYYKKPIMVPTNGHILIDAMSDLVKINCDNND